MSGSDSNYGGSQNPVPSNGASTSTGNNYSSSQSGGGGYSDPSNGSSGYGLSTPAQPAPSPDTPNSSRLMFGNGVNMQPSYSENGDVDLGWELVKSIPSIKTVRLEIEDFAVDAAVRWITEANARGYTVIATYHNFDAIDHKPPECDPKHMQMAIDFWNSNYKKLSAAGPFIINVMNEWGHAKIKAKSYAEQYNAAIREIRALKYNGPLILDLPGSGQLAQVAADAVEGAGGISPIQDRNVVLSMHVYPVTWNGKGPLETKDVELLVQTGRPCMIGEFGESNKSPNTDWRAIVDYAKSNNLPVLAWSWDGDGTIMNIMWPEFLKFVPGKAHPNYRINADYANIVLPYLS
jgi:mannan endo-1,4-beta-mannosidase